MQVRIKDELIPICVLVVVLVLFINFLPDSWVRVVLGLPFLLFIPGYVLIAALFYRKSALGGIERIALSFGMSIAVVPLIGLGLNYTPWGIRLEPVMYSVSSFIFIMSGVAWFRRRSLPEEELYNFVIPLRRPKLQGSRLDKSLTIILALSILAAVGTLIYTVANPKVGERFTEFYILGAETGKAEGYPTELKVGEAGQVILGITNREHEPTTYRVEITINGTKVNDYGPISLEHEETWEEPVTFTPIETGENQKVEFLLYKQGETDVYLTLHLWFLVI